MSLWVAYGALLSMAVVPIYMGSLTSIASVKRPKDIPRPPKIRAKTSHPLEDSDVDSDSESSVTESLSSSDAYMFPVMGSCVLFGLYLVFRFLDKEWVNLLLSGYFAVLGVFALAKSGLLAVKAGVRAETLRKLRVEKYKIALYKAGKQQYGATFTYIHFLLLLVSALVTVYYTLTKNWIASNLLGLAFSINAIQLLSLDSFKTGMILLAGLFCYDIFWVFGTEVMVSVAKNFDAPIKVVFPKDIFDYATGGVPGFTMLGLGDIVIPGIFVALCLRFDHHQFWRRQIAQKATPNVPSAAFRSLDFPKPYFKTNLTFYFLGLVTTMVVMHVFQAAQPALLYLSPACSLSALALAVYRGEVKEFFAYSSDEDEKEKKDKEKEKEKEKESKGKNSSKDEAPLPQPSISIDHGAEADIEDDDFVAVNADADEGDKKSTRKRKSTRRKK